MRGCQPITAMTAVCAVHVQVLHAHRVLSLQQHWHRLLKLLRWLRAKFYMPDTRINACDLSQGTWRACTQE
jgi:hypothetical protein